MLTGRPRFDKRDSVILDLKEAVLYPSEIAQRYSISLRLVYNIAVEAGISVPLRAQLLRLLEQRQRLDEAIKKTEELFRSGERNESIQS